MARWWWWAIKVRDQEVLERIVYQKCYTTEFVYRKWETDESVCSLLARHQRTDLFCRRNLIKGSLSGCSSTKRSRLCGPVQRPESQASFRARRHCKVDWSSKINPLSCFREGVRMSKLWSDDVYDDDCDRDKRWIDGAGFWIALAVIWTLILLVGGVILFAVF